MHIFLFPKKEGNNLTKSAIPYYSDYFGSCTKINSFTLLHNESYEVNLLLTTRLTSNSKTIKLVDARQVVSSACTSSNVFISGIDRWKFVFGQEGAQSLFFIA